MRFPRHAKIFTGQINAGPFMAFFFLLLVIFAFNQILVSVPGVRIQLPVVESPQYASHPAVYLAVHRSGQLYYESQAIQFKALGERLRAVVKRAGTPLTLVLQVDAGTAYEQLNPLYKLADETGFREVVLAGQPPLFPGVAAVKSN
jgi:biopolymer transport protein ExbD